MKFLECLVPPPAVGIVACVLMWFARDIGPHLPLPFVARVLIGVALAAFGMALAGRCARTFIGARTTLNPTKPAEATVLVTHGAFARSRNPMYVAMGVTVIGWGIGLGAIPALLLGLLLFVLWITRFQILPEERALRDLFGAEFDAYCARVRRWV